MFWNFRQDGLDWISTLWEKSDYMEQSIKHRSVLNEYSLKILKMTLELLNDPKLLMFGIICLIGLIWLLIFLFSAPIRFRHHYSPVNIECLHPNGNEKIKIGLMDLIERDCPSLFNGTFYPTPWLLSGHSQTIYAALMGSWFKANRISFSRVTLTTPDGGVISGTFIRLINS